MIILILIIIIILIKACYPFQTNEKDTEYNVEKHKYTYDLKKKLASSSQIIRLVIIYE